MGVKGANNQRIGAMNQSLALDWIETFGWLRPHELGTLLWPGANHRCKQGERLARQLIEGKAVLERRLPFHQSRALVLSELGAATVRQNGYWAGNELLQRAKSGKDWGRMVDQAWQPPASWRHDLLATSLLVEMRAKGMQILTEREMRWHHPTLVKQPDGLVKMGEICVWLEVEQARKSGDSMAAMAKTVELVHSQRVKKLAGGWIPTVAAVAYPGQVLDERGYQVNHRERILSGLRKHTTGQVEVVLIELKLKPSGYAVESFTAEQVVIAAAPPGELRT